MMHSGLKGGGARCRAGSLAMVLVIATALLAATAQAEKPRGGKEYFTDVELIDQNGNPQRLYTDLMEDKIVVISSLFTDCTGSCPVMARTVQRIQDHLGERVGDDVHLISITVNPERDTPERLAEFGARFDAGPGWYLLTGEKENVQTALGRLGQWVDDPEAHATIFLIGNLRTGLWKKAFGLSASKEILAIIDSVVQDTGGAG